MGRQDSFQRTKRRIERCRFPNLPSAKVRNLLKVRISNVTGQSYSAASSDVADIELGLFDTYLAFRPIKSDASADEPQCELKAWATMLPQAQLGFAFRGQEKAFVDAWHPQRCDQPHSSSHRRVRADRRHGSGRNITLQDEEYFRSTKLSRSTSSSSDLLCHMFFLG